MHSNPYQTEVTRNFSNPSKRKRLGNTPIKEIIPKIKYKVPGLCLRSAFPENLPPRTHNKNK